MRRISCQFLLPGGSMGPHNVLQLLFGEKSQKQRKTRQLKLGKK
jgi:hypothetical protein